MNINDHKFVDIVYMHEYGDFVKYIIEKGRPATRPTNPHMEAYQGGEDLSMMLGAPGEYTIC